MYRSALSIVKRAYGFSTARVMRLAASLFLSAWGFGCAAAPGKLNAEYRIAVRYDVEPVRIGHGEAAFFERIGSDLTRAGELGFDTVVFAHLEDHWRTKALEMAARCGMAGVVSDRDLQHFVRTGRLPQGFRNVVEIVRAAIRALANRPGFAGLAMDHVSSAPAPRERLARVAKSLQAVGVSCVILTSSNNALDDGFSFAIVDAGELAEAANRSPSERLLAGYHAELAAGRTAGLVVDRFARAPGGRAGLNAVDEPPVAAKMAAVQGLLRRAKRWGPMLHGFHGESVGEFHTEGLGVSLIAFVRDQRRFILAYNPSSDRYIRGSVAVPASISGKTVSRLVEVPPIPDRVAGDVFEAQRGGVIVRVDLRPGDAALFEVF